MAANRPDVWFGLALNADPNDPYVSPVWTDFTPNLRKVTGLERGRNFELDQPMASEPSLLIRDVNELLNPANPSSPHVNLVQPYREACLLAQWPNTPVGGAVNLFNTGAWRGNKVDAYDGSFESFATGGPRPNWATPLGGAANFVIDAGTPFQGAKDLAYTVASNTNWQGFSWPVACIPGRQYTCSVYVRQTTASTQRISVADQVVAADPFNQTGSNGWGTDRLGHAWSALIGASSVYSYSNLVATIAPEAQGVDRIISVDTGALDHTTHVRFIAPDPALIGNTSATSGVAVRISDANNYINPTVIWRADGTAGLATFKRVGGVRSTVVAEVSTGWIYAAGQEFILEITTQTVGTTVNVNSLAWPVVKPRPAAYQNTATATDAALLGGTRVGCSGRVESTTGISLPFALRYAAFDVAGYVHGGSTTATGAYTRVSVTFTATQPVHTVQLATTGTAVAGTVLADAIQHEQAAAPSAYATSGPAIYPVMRNLVEQWPRTYLSAGFEGYVEAPCVDALAALQSITLQSEYAQAVLNTGPDYYYRLDDGRDTLAFADTSGNGGPPLAPLARKLGGGVPPAPQTQIAITGDPGASGVFFDVTAPGTGAATDLATARGAVAIPPVSGAPWALTFAAWAQVGTDDNISAWMNINRLFSANDFSDSWRVLFETTNIPQTFLGITNQGLGANCTSPVDYRDGLVHHVACRVSQDVTNTALDFWIDGVQRATNTVATATIGMLGSMNLLEVGGTVSWQAPSGVGANVMDGTISSAAFWNRRLSDAELATLYAAGASAYAGETTGARIARHIALGGYTGPTRITTTGAMTTMQAATWTGTKDLLTDSLETATAEQGNLWAAPDGSIVAESRQDRWLRLTPSFVLGENTAGGEIPYLMDGARFVADPLYVYAKVQIGRVNGATAQGGTAQDIAVASRRNFPRSLEGSFDFATDDIAQSMANFIFNSHDAPMTRVDALTVDPASNPALWPFALGLENGQRGTVKRRAKAANSGAGITMSADYFVEKISIDAIGFDTGEWTYRVQLSPINAAAGPGQPTMQPWILGDATYGVLNSTTVLGW